MLSPIHEYERDRVFIGMHAAYANHQLGVNGKVSGNLAALSLIRDAQIVLHGPKGCAHHYRYFARRRYLPLYDLISTDLTEAEVIGGGEQKLHDTLLSILHAQSPGCIVVVPTVASDIMQDDIQGVLDGLRPLSPCPLLAIRSEVFSNIDKPAMRAGQRDALGSWGKRIAPPSLDNRGCGFSEAMVALVDQLMQPQKALSRTVNLEAFAWGNGSRARLDGIASTLEAMGIRLLTRLPNCTTRQIQEAPAAQLNLARRVRWALRAQEKFGQRLLQLHGFSRYLGVDGILRFYQEIAELMDLPSEVVHRLDAPADKTRARLSACRQILARKRFLLMPRFYTMLPNAIVEAALGSALPLKYVCARMEPERMRMSDYDQAMTDSVFVNIRKALDLVGSDAQLIINPDASQLKALCQEVDVVIGQEDAQLLCPSTPVLPMSALEGPLDFDGLCDHVESIAARLDHLPSAGQLLLGRLPFAPGSYPQLEDGHLAISRELWEQLWQKRGLCP